MVDRRHQADRSRHGDSAQHRPKGLRSRAYEARGDQPGGYRAESAQREQDAGGPLAVAEVCEQQGVERDGKRKRQRREVGAKHRILDDPLMEQAPVADQQAVPDGRPSRGRLCAQAGKEGQQPGGRQGEESGLEARCGQEKSAQRSAGDLAYVGRCVEASQLDAARPRQLACQRPGRRPERGPRQDQGELAKHQHPEPMGEHEPDAGYDARPARTQHDAPSADAVGVGAAGEVEGDLSQDRRREQRTDLGIGQPFGMGVQRHRKPGHAEAEIPRQRGEEKELMRHGTLWVAGP